jgi:DNA (cytosine-5)-methyltransferase 1
MNTNKNKIRAIDLFAGAGGFSLAAKSIGIDVKAAVEFDENAADTYRNNFIDSSSEEILYNEDITKLSPETLLNDLGLNVSELELLIGGPPCQGYSRHRFKDQGVADPRNKLLITYFDFVSVIKPKVFLVENVPGLLWKRHELHLKSFYSLAKKAGYSVFKPIKVNAKDYGVPQNRQRVFILGVRNDLSSTDIKWPPAPTHFPIGKGKLPEWKTASSVFSTPTASVVKKIKKVIGEESFNSLQFGNELKSAFIDENSVHMTHRDYMVERFSKTPIHGSREDSGELLPCHANGYKGHKDVYGRIFLNKPGPTMTTGCMNPSKGRFLHPWENHGITIRHTARFQTFPDSFKFSGGIISQARQVGNAVPVELGKVLLKNVTKLIQQNSAEENTKLMSSIK